MSMNFPSSPTVGQQYSVSGGPTYTWDGSVWKVLTPGQQYLPTIFTATAGQTTFTISGGYVIGAIDVFRNGVKLVSGSDYTATDLSTVVLIAACSAGDTVEVITLSQILYSQALKKTGDTMTGDLAVPNLSYTGTLTGGTGVIAIGTTQFVKDTSGNIGIGTASPLQALDIGIGNISLSSSGSQKLGIFKSGSAFAFTGPLLYSYDSSGLGIGTGNSPIVFGTNNFDRGRIDSAGNWLVGSNNSTYATKVMVENNSTSLSPKNFITIRNRGTVGAYTSSYTVGGVLFSAYRDVRDPANIAGMWAVRDSAASGLSSLGNLVFGTSEGTNIDQDGILPTERMRINTNGVLVFAGGNTAASGIGIAFPATQSASSDANTLDDYEEGTWTPTDGSGAGLSISSNGAQYIKIGKMVWLYCYVTYPTNSNATGAAIGNLPFTVAGGLYPQLTVRPTSAISSGIVAQASAGGTTVGFYIVNSGAGAVTNAALSTFAVLITGCYQASN